MFELPEELKPFHQRESKRLPNIKACIEREANLFYRLEGKYIDPIFAMSPTVIAKAKFFKAIDSERAFFKAIKNHFNELAVMFDLEQQVHYKLNNVSKNNKSYYHQGKQTVFINKNYLLKIFNRQPSYKDKFSKIIAILIHELTHTFIHLKLEMDGIHIHDHVFYHFYIKFLSLYSGIATKKFANKPTEDGGYYNIKDELITRTLKDEIKDKHFYFLANSKELYQFGSYPTKEIALESVKKAYDKAYLRNSLPYYIDYLHTPENELEQLFPDVKIFFYEMHGKVIVYFYKEFKYQLRSFKNYEYILRMRFERTL